MAKLASFRQMKGRCASCVASLDAHKKDLETTIGQFQVLKADVDKHTGGRKDIFEASTALEDAIEKVATATSHMERLFGKYGGTPDRLASLREALK